MVPTGTFSRMSSPWRPVLFDPSPCRPRWALYSGLKRKWTSVLCCSLDSMMTLPPSPALTRIVASSINMNTTATFDLTMGGRKRCEHASTPGRWKTILSAFLLLISAVTLATPRASAQQDRNAPKAKASLSAKLKLTPQQEQGVRLLKSAEEASASLQPDMHAFVLWQAANAYSGIVPAKTDALLRQAFLATQSIEVPTDDPTCGTVNFCVKGWLQQFIMNEILKRSSR